MIYIEVKNQVMNNPTKIAKRQAWKIDKFVDRDTIFNVNESDKMANDWLVLENLNE